MKNSRLILMALAAMFMQNVYAQQPYGGCWHPDDIKNWSPETDKDAKFNRARVPLANRFKEPTLMKANQNQYYEGQICDATILFPTCSMCPSQGANNFLGYQPTYWQYMDKLVYWAGSASEGIIIPPPAPSIDAAHAQGVKALGQIFFPPTAYGGTMAWVDQMLTKEEGKYIYAQKLYEIAKYMGFDGWFINEETGFSDEAWAPFVKEFMEIAEANGDTQMEIQWYNADRSPSKKMLTTHKNTSQFLEYGAAGDYRSEASELGCSEAETFSKIYAGVQTVSNGHTGWGPTLRKAMPTTGHVGSLDLFCPEERIWKDNVKEYLGSSTDNHGSVAYAAMTKTFDNEEDMWVNFEGDPSQISSDSWPGVSGAVLERSAISSMPFVSSMSVGDGKHRFVEGKVAGTQDWYHSGMQSILPTWRWWIENKGDLKVTIDWDNAWNVGSSFKVAGKLSAGDHLMRLYKTMIPVANGGTLRLVYKSASKAALEAKLSTSSSTTPDVTLTAAKTTEKNGWTIADFDLSSLNGKTVYMIAFNIKADAEISDFALNLGEVAVLPKDYAPNAVEVKNLATDNRLGELKGDIRVTWDFDYNADFDHFDIYTETADGKLNLVGQTRDEAFYIPSFERNANDAYITVKVVPVMKDMKQQKSVDVKNNYPTPKAPEVTLSLSKSYVKVGESVTLTANGSGNPKSFEWVLPEGLKLAEGSKLTDQTITVVATTVGKQVVTVKATNDVGTSTTTIDALDVMADDAALAEVQNVALKKTVVGFNGSTNSTEVPDNIIDGVENPQSTSAKWCNVGADNWVTIDLENAYRIYGFKIFDANSGPESGCDQIDSYTIELSNDGENWTTVVEREGEDKISIKEAYIPPMKARYVRLSPHVNGTLRIWEFEVFGRDDSNLTMSLETNNMTMEAGETRNLTVKYDLGGDERDAQFKCVVTPSNNLVTIGEITEDKANSTFTVPVVASKQMGETDLTVQVNNGGSYKESVVKVTLDCDTQPNVLSGVAGKVRQYSTDGDASKAKYTEYDAIGLTDGDNAADAFASINDLQPSTHSKDIVAYVANPDGEWDISKVRVHLPNNNKGENDNGVSGIVNKEISIAIGNKFDKLSDLTVVKTFENLGEVSELECILPESRGGKYVAVICTLNSYYYGSMAEIEAFEQLATKDGPVTINGWNYDVINEVYEDESTTNGSLDSNGYVFYSASAKKAGAISDDSRKVTTKNGTVFRLAPYTSNNALVMKDDDSHTLTLGTPAACSEVQLLFTSADGTSTFTVVPNYSDGTSGEAKEMTADDWYNTNENQGEAVYGLGRFSPYDWYYEYNYNFRLFEDCITLDEHKTLKSLTVTRTSGGVPTVFAVSKTGFEEQESGINEIFNAESKNDVIYNVAGQRVNRMQKGHIYIIGGKKVYKK